MVIDKARHLRKGDCQYRKALYLAIYLSITWLTASKSADDLKFRRKLVPYEINLVLYERAKIKKVLCVEMKLIKIKQCKYKF